ncbi:MAG: 3-methyl-2-oxobutanoate hydroxymethyltransferase [Phycisphaeraceae bacterium]|nr:3-methyl-2-oxobutanoate hydroxymethyltransferase [Phycisphaeraceae bacterium]
MPSSPPDKKIRLSTLRQWAAAGQKFAMLTCYDATTARLFWQAGLKTLLVGDTAGQFVLGHETTLPAPLDFMLQITAAVRRAAPLAFVMGDMPFGSYQCGQDAGMANAMRFLTEGGADAVKLEVSRHDLPLVERMAAAGVPVVAHLGSRPQQKLTMGRSRKVYHSAEEVRQTVQLAGEMVRAGAVMILLEAVPAEVSVGVIEAIREQSPKDEQAILIGCGAGPACHGHVVVMHDVLGLTGWHAPFAPPQGDVGGAIRETAAKWVALAESGRYLAEDHPYHVEG